MMEQLYQDFTTKLLPQLQSGLVIGKDYFLDLFGRYIKYLIVIDSIGMAIGLFLLIGFGIGLYKIIKFGRKRNWEDEWILVIFFSIIILLVGSVVFFNGLFYLVKDIYIPGVRIIEILNRVK